MYFLAEPLLLSVTSFKRLQAFIRELPVCGFFFSSFLSLSLFLSLPFLLSFLSLFLSSPSLFPLLLSFCFSLLFFLSLPVSFPFSVSLPRLDPPSPSPVTPNPSVVTGDFAVRVAKNPRLTVCFWCAWVVVFFFFLFPQQGTGV